MFSAPLAHGFCTLTLAQQRGNHTGEQIRQIITSAVFPTGIWDGFQHLDQRMQMRLGEQVLSLFFSELRENTR